MKTLISMISLLVILLTGSNYIYAAITINEDTIEVSTDTLYSIDDDLVSSEVFETKSNGHIATVISDDSITANEVSVHNHIKGPVTNLDPFQVFGQDVVIDTDTILVNNNGSFNLGDLLEVSGYFNTSNVFLTTRVELKSSLNNWRLIGHVQSIFENEIVIGLLTFDVSNTMVEDCEPAIEVGNIVKVKIPAISNFSTSTLITNIEKFKCKKNLADVPENSENFEFHIEGFVSKIIDVDNFKIADQQIVLTSSTIYINGSHSDIVPGVKLEAEGELDSSTNNLTADKIKFKNARVRIEAAVSVSDINQEQITILGISGIFTTFTEDDDDLISNGLSVDSNVEVRGSIDSIGNLFIEELRERGEYDASETRLRGPIADITTDSFTIVGVAIDTTTAQYFIEEQAVDMSTFFSSLVVGYIVDVNHGRYDEETNTLFAGEITLEEADDNNSAAKSISSSSNGLLVGGSVSYGTITSFTPASEVVVNPPIIVQPEVSNSGGGSTGLMVLLLLTLGLIRRR